jgi:hypothetical protein
MCFHISRNTAAPCRRKEINSYAEIISIASYLIRRKTFTFCFMIQYCTFFLLKFALQERFNEQLFESEESVVFKIVKS